MKARVLFFDDEPQTAPRLRKCLEAEGYTIATPTTIDEAFVEISMKRAELIVHAAHRTQTHRLICSQILGRFPNFPSIHLATGVTGEDHLDELKGPYHLKVRPLTPEKKFLKLVKKLIFFGRLQRENDVLRKTVELQRRADHIADSLDLNGLKREAVQIFGQEFNAENAYFLSPGAYGYFLQEMWKVTSLQPEDENKASKHAIVSYRPTSEADFSRLIGSVADALPRDWELRRERTDVHIKFKNGKTLNCSFIPFVGHQNRRVLGHLLLVEPLVDSVVFERAIETVARAVGRQLEHVASFAGVKSLSYLDDLTELYNQRYLKLVLDKEINRCQRSGEVFSVLFMDIDHFKRVNDSRGHLVGSKVLIELSKILHKNIRTMDYGFRYGGDEFILVLVGTGAEEAFTVAERIRQSVEGSTFDLSGVNVQVTISIGVATYPDHATTRDQILELADRAMYCGKNKSRNVVYVAS